MKRLSYFLLAFILGVFNSVNAQYFRNLNMKDGLSQPSVMAIYQDTLGRMWFGTREGINIYDGNQITSLKPKSIAYQTNSHFVTGNEIKSIIGSKTGDVFVLVGSEFYKYDINNESYSLVFNKPVNAIANSVNQNVLFARKDSLFIYDVTTNKFDTYLDLSALHKLPVVAICDTPQKIWLGTQNGIFSIHKTTSKVEHFLEGVEISELFYSSRKYLWIGTRRDGLFSVNRDGELVSYPIGPHSVVSNQIREFIEDDNQNIWFGTFDGLQVYNPFNQTFKVYVPNQRQGALSHSSVFSLYNDRQGTIWVGTYYGGVDYFNPHKDIFTYYPYNTLRDDCVNFQIIGDMIEDNDHNLWIATDGGGINFLDEKKRKFTYYTTENSNVILHNNVKTIAYDKKRDVIYFGTHTGGLSKLDRKTGRVKHFLSQSSKTKGFGAIIFYAKINNDYLYVSSRTGFWRLDLETERLELLTNDHYFRNFDFDSKGDIWLTNSFKLFRIKKDSPYDIKEYPLHPSVPSKATITKLFVGKDDIIYIGTSGSGFFTYDTALDKIQHFTREDNSLLSNYCYNICESPNSNLLITSDKGLSIYSPFTQAIHSVLLNGKQGISAITNGCGLFVKSNELIYLGGVDGLVSFRENDIFKEPRVDSRLYFSTLYVNNEQVYPNDESRVLKKSLPFTDNIVLSDSQKSFKIYFSYSDYVDTQRNSWYQYKLEGFDKQWISTTSSSLSYTNLPAGTYTLKLREMGNLLNRYESKNIQLKIKVKAPWYGTVYAYLFYIFVLGFIIYFIWKYQMNRKIYQLSLQQERNENERIKDVNQMKLRFFTNISHEFRTPLTLIVGQLDILSQESDLSISVRRKLQRIYSNTIHLRNLVTELLDFRKQEQGYVKLKVERRDIITFVQDIFLDFKEYAHKLNIEYSFEHSNDSSIYLWFDQIQLQKAIYNLLSNAFKFTPEKGSIRVSISKTQEKVNIEIADSGCGIPKESLDHIFERFYQADNLHSNLKPGTGIGLALTKGVIELHKGTINVTSVEGKGTKFIISLLTGNSHFSPDEIEKSDHAMTVANDGDNNIIDLNLIRDKFSVQGTDAAGDEPVNVHHANEETVKPIMLIVEDDKQIVDLLEEVFAPMYIIEKAYNGQEGFDMARKNHPDIIVSDVMMPVLSGKEMCYKIKNCLEISHIPIVLLTAQTAVDQVVEGYMFGADDYITKPFNIKVLVSRCNNLVNNRKALISKFQSAGQDDTTIEKKVSIGLNAADQKLVDQATQIIRENFENPDFDMNLLAELLNIGRSKLYSKFKEVTGITPNEFTLRIKLEEGQNLLRNAPELNISEISYKLGFTSLRYFSKCFKSFYGISPQIYRKNLTSTSQDSES